MSLKAQLEAIIYATEEPVTLNELAVLLKDAVLADMRAEEEARLAFHDTISDDALPSQAEDKANLVVDEPSASQTLEGSASPAMTETASPEIAAQNQSSAPDAVRTKKDQRQAEEKEELKRVRARLSTVIDELITDYDSADRGMEIRQVAGGYRMTTKPEHHDVVIGFAKSLKPPVRLSLQALETLSVIAYKQPVTVPEISEIRGVDSAGVIATLLDRKLITTAGRKQVIGRPILYKTTKEFLLRFGLNDVSELPSMEEFEKLGEPQAELFAAAEPETASAASSVASESEPVTEAVPERNPDSSLIGETAVPADGTYATEAEPTVANPPEGSGETR